jgi:hypothetical protein
LIGHRDDRRIVFGAAGLQLQECAMRSGAWIVVPVLIGVLLGGRTPALTRVDAVATAVLAGCWPGDSATPSPVTVTPYIGQDDASLPTTTPYPRCTPQPGVLPRAW